MEFVRPTVIQDLEKIFRMVNPGGPCTKFYVIWPSVAHGKDLYAICYVTATTLGFWGMGAYFGHIFLKKGIKFVCIL